MYAATIIYNQKHTIGEAVIMSLLNNSQRAQELFFHPRTQSRAGL